MTRKHCIYCLAVDAKLNKDHIFNDWYGGKKRVTSCEVCNTRFSKEFESIAANEFLVPLYTALSTVGLNFRLDLPKWRKAFKASGEEFDQILGSDGIVRMTLSKPKVLKNSSGGIGMVLFRSEKEANEGLKRLIAKTGKTHLRIEKMPVKFKGFRQPFSYDMKQSTFLLAMKMAVALATRLPNFDPLETLLGRMTLFGESTSEKLVSETLTHMKKIDSLRPPLSHMVYVERSSGITKATVQFFGTFKFDCKLGRPDPTVPDAAVLGWFDPIAKKESFSECSPIGLDVYNRIHDELTRVRLAERWNERLDEEARAAGSTKKIDLHGEIIFE